jgi:hypothetical protein
MQQWARLTTLSSLLDTIRHYLREAALGLMCQECGNERIQSEPFMSISLPLSKEFKGDNEMPGGQRTAGVKCRSSVA